MLILFCLDLPRSLRSNGASEQSYHLIIHYLYASKTHTICIIWSFHDSDFLRRTHPTKHYYFMKQSWQFCKHRESCHEDTHSQILTQIFVLRRAKNMTSLISRIIESWGSNALTINSFWELGVSFVIFMTLWKCVISFGSTCAKKSFDTWAHVCPYWE